MSVKVFWGEDGRPYAEAQTVAEALELIKAGSNGFGKHPPKPETQTTVVPAQAREGIPERVKRVFAEGTEKSVAVLKVLAKYQQGIEGEALGEEAHVQVGAFGGILGGVTKLARKNGFKDDDFVVSEQKIEGSRRVRRYWPGKVLLEYIYTLGDTDLGWKADTMRTLIDIEEGGSKSGRIKAGGGA